MKTDLKFQELAVFIECSTGSTPTMETLKNYIDLMSTFGYTHLYLGLTDAYKMEGEPYFNFCRGGYTTEQLQELDSYAETHGMELRVNIQVLGHLHFLSQHDCYGPLMDTAGVLMVGQEEVYQFVEKMIATMSKSVKSRIIHIGMDETHGLGLGRYLDQHEYTDTRTLFITHLQRVAEIAKKYGYLCEIWSDMFYYMIKGSIFTDDGVVPDDLKDSIPENVRIVHWCYRQQTDEAFVRQMEQVRSICDEVSLAGCAYKHIGLAPDNKFSIGVTKHQIEMCQKVNVERFMMTLWSDAGAHCSIYAVLPTMFAAAEMAKGKAYEEIDKNKFKDVVGVAYDDFMLLDNLNNPFFKDLDNLNSTRSYFGLLSDMFLGSYDLMFDMHTNDAYALLAKKYENVEAGEYKMLFENYRLYSRVLSLKMNLGVLIRDAYHNNKADSLRKYATQDIPQMIEYMKQFVAHYEDWWQTENMAFGLEVHHLYYGGQLRRWEYVAKRILQYLEDGKPIDEMEREELLPSYIPYYGEDRCFEMNCHKLISRCGF